MSLSSYLQNIAPSGELLESVQEDQALSALLREALLQRLPSEQIVELIHENETRARLEVMSVLALVAKTKNFEMLDNAKRQHLIEEVANSVLGLGPLEQLLDDSEVTEIMVNGHDSIFYESKGCLHPSDVCFSDEGQLRMVIDRILGPLSRRVDE